MEKENSSLGSEDCCSMWRIESCTSLAINHFGMAFEMDTLSQASKKTEPTKCPELPSNRPLTILDLPPELLEQIFLKLSFDNVGKARAVCQYFNTVASSLLNSEFSRLRMNMHHRFQNIKAQMPRRESARRKHPLARESDIIETLHMRLTLLQMAFGKHIERKHCCFFAGEILDEVYRILRYVKSTPTLNRAYKVTDELFDLSTMAMEYFKEHVEPSLPEITYFTSDFLEYAPSIASSPKAHLSFLEESGICSASTSSSASPKTSIPRTALSPLVSKKLRRLHDSMKRSNDEVLSLKRELKTSKKRLLVQQKQINDLKARQLTYDQKFLSTSRKLSFILQELNRCKTELQYWRSKSPAAHCSCGKGSPGPDVREIKYFAPEKSSPESHDESADDFKPIFIDLESQPSCSSSSRHISSSTYSTIHCKTVAPWSCRVNSKEVHTEEEETEEIESAQVVVNSKTRKRKFNASDYADKKNKKFQSDVSMYVPLYHVTSSEEGDSEDDGDNYRTGCNASTSSKCDSDS